MTDTTSLWPDVYALGWVRLEDYEGELPTRIEDYDKDLVTIGVPFQRNGDVVVPHLKSHFFLGWPGDKSVFEVAVQLMEVRHQPVPVWICRATSKPVEVQRRNFVRVEASLEINLAMNPGGAPIKAVTIDLSEGGARTLVDRWASDPGLRRFKVQVPLEKGDLIVDAQVVWWGNMQGEDRRLVGIRFVELETQQSDLLRRRVFALQLEARRRDS